MRKIIFSAALTLLCSSHLFAGVNVNALDAETLALELDGVGLSKAQAIVDYRTANGEFTSIDDLMSVKGIGPAIVEKNKEVIDFE